MTDMTAPPEPENGRCPDCGVPQGFEHLSGYGCPEGVWQGDGEEASHHTPPQTDE